MYKVTIWNESKGWDPTYRCLEVWEQDCKLNKHDHNMIINAMFEYACEEGILANRLTTILRNMEHPSKMYRYDLRTNEQHNEYGSGIYSDLYINNKFIRRMVVAEWVH